MGWVGWGCAGEKTSSRRAPGPTKPVRLLSNAHPTCWWGCAPSSTWTPPPPSDLSPPHIRSLGCPLQALVGLRSIEHVDACGNQLKRGGACALAKACARKPALALLALDENEISDAGLDALRVRLTVLVAAVMRRSGGSLR